MQEREEIDWGAFFRLYRPLALRVARGLVRAPDRAEELVQEAASALVERERTRSEGAPSPYESVEHARNTFLRTLRNLAVSELRREGRRGTHEEAIEVHDPRPGAPETLALVEERDARVAAVHAVLEGLAPAERESLNLRYDLGLAYREMSERTGVSISTLQARVEAGLRKIRDRLGNPSLEA